MPKYTYPKKKNSNISLNKKNKNKTKKTIKEQTKKIQNLWI